MARRSRPQQGPLQPATAEPHAPALPFPVEVFPSPLRRFIREVAEALPCPADFVGVPLLAVLGAAIGTSRVLQVKPGWPEGPRLFTAVVADPGRKKSPALALVMQPVRERQQRLQAAAEHARPAEEGDDVQPSGSLPLAGDPRETPPSSSPMMPQLYTTDATLEALIQLLHQNPRGLLFVRDELTGWILGMNMYKHSKGNDRQHWLSLWNGADILVNRKTRKEVTVVPNPFVCVTGCLSTEVISDLEDVRGRRDGLLARLLFAVPDPVPLRWTETSVTEATMAGYTQLLEALWQLAPEGDSAARQGSHPVSLALTHRGGRPLCRGSMPSMHSWLTLIFLMTCGMCMQSSQARWPGSPSSSTPVMWSLERPTRQSTCRVCTGLCNWSAIFRGMPNGSMRVCGAPGPISGPRRRSGGSKPMAGRVRGAISNGIGWLASPAPRRRRSCYGTSWIWGRGNFESAGCPVGGRSGYLSCTLMPHRQGHRASDPTWGSWTGLVCTTSQPHRQPSAWHVTGTPYTGFVSKAHVSVPSG